MSVQRAGSASQLINGESCVLLQGRRPSRGLRKLPTAMEMAMPEKLIVSAGGGAGLRLKRGEQLRIVDIEGGQTGDLVAFSTDGKQRLSSGRTFDYGGKSMCPLAMYFGLIAAALC